MSAPRVDLAALRVEPAAEWFGRRLAGLLPGGGDALTEPVAWCLHQWMDGHACLDCAKPIAGRLADTADGAEAEAMPPAGWLDALRGADCIARAESGSLEAIDAALVLEGSRLFLARCRAQEVRIARALAARARESAAWAHTPAALQSLEVAVAGACVGLEPEQATAVRLAASRRLALVTGGPGTGKTTIAARVIAAVHAVHPGGVRLLAPTGKAAQRLQQSVRESAADERLGQGARQALAALEASTLHAALMQDGASALRGAKLVVLDETSMVDLERMDRLLATLPADASLVMLGDPRQLASVEAGSVLGDIAPRPGEMEHPLAACTATLARSRRFPPESGVGKLAALVEAGRSDEALELLRAGEGPLRWVPASKPSEVVSRAVQARRSHGEEARILCGHRHGPDGALRVNAAIERGRGGQGGEPRYEGRPIIVRVNDANTGLRNGDAGILRVAADGWQVDFPDLGLRLPIERLPAHETAFALTIHKTQGSEYQAVVVALPARPSPVLTRELLYTGITRTRGPITVVASEACLRASIERPIVRHGSLRERLSRAATEPHA